MANISDRQQIKYICLALIWASLAIIGNLTFYSSCIYPNVKIKYLNLELSIITIIFEAIYMVTGFHVFRVFHFAIINQLYASTNTNSPKIYTYLFNTLECIVVIAVIVCYSCVFIFGIYWLIIFYIILSIIIVITSTFTLHILGKILSILNVSVISNTDKQVIWAIRYIKTGYIVELIIAMYSFFNVLSSFDIIFDFGNISFNKILSVLISHSVLSVGLGILLLLRIYRTNTCCSVPDNSICIVYGCSCPNNVNNEDTIDSAGKFHLYYENVLNESTTITKTITNKTDSTVQ
eukprot:231906_1